MAIYSVNVSAIGKGTQKKAGTAGAHVGYITRSTAAVAVLAARMPTARIGSRGGAARKWLDAQEQADRKNGRVVTKVMVALPHELTDEQRADLVRDFCERMTAGRGSWLAAIHRPSGDDERNHHAHIVLRDKDFETGKVVVGLSNAKSVDLIREEWERFANAALEAAGESARIDRRSLEDQGEVREPSVHVGPAVTAIERRGDVSRVRVRIEGHKNPKPLSLSDLLSTDEDPDQEARDVAEWLVHQEGQARLNSVPKPTLAVSDQRQRIRVGYFPGFSGESAPAPVPTPPASVPKPARSEPRVGFLPGVERSIFAPAIKPEVRSEGELYLAARSSSDLEIVLKHATAELAGGESSLRRGIVLDASEYAQKTAEIREIEAKIPKEERNLNKAEYRLEVCEKEIAEWSEQVGFFARMRPPQEIREKKVQAEERREETQKISGVLSDLKSLLGRTKKLFKSWFVAEVNSPKLDDRWRWRSAALTEIKMECETTLTARTKAREIENLRLYELGQANQRAINEQARREREAQDRARLEQVQESAAPPPVSDSPEQDDDFEDNWDDSPSPGM